VAASATLVEDQVDDREDGGQPAGGRHRERDGGVADLVLGAGQPLAHRLGRDEEGPGDLFGRRAAEGAQGQCHLGVERERGMAAGEDQLERRLSRPPRPAIRTAAGTWPTSATR